MIVGIVVAISVVVSIVHLCLMAGSENPLPIGQSVGDLSGSGGLVAVRRRIKVSPVARPL